MVYLASALSRSHRHSDSWVAELRACSFSVALSLLNDRYAIDHSSKEGVLGSKRDPRGRRNEDAADYKIIMTGNVKQISGDRSDQKI